MKTKLFTLLFAVVASTNMLFAESGTCGQNLTWDLTNGILTISGTGTMSNYNHNSMPWYSQRNSINSIVILDGIISIGEYAFYDCNNLSSVTIPNSVSIIGNCAFGGNNSLTSPVFNTQVFAYMPPAYSGTYTISDGIESIANYAFNGCTGLTSVTIPNSILTIGNLAFYGCTNLTSITIPNSVTNIGGQAFYCCYKLSSIEIPNSVTSIGDLAFTYCNNLISVNINSNAIASQNYTTKNTISSIFGSQVTTYIIGDSVTSIGDFAFYNCSNLTSVTIGNDVTSIGNSAFYGCSGLTSVTIPNSVTSIGNSAFNGCTGLTSVTIPNSVTSIGNYAFRDCSGLTSVTIIAETPPTLGSNAFEHGNNYPLYVPCGTLDAYKSNWSVYASRIKYGPLDFTVTGDVDSEEKGFVSISSNVCEGTNITAVPNYGFMFTQWNDGNTDNPRTIELTQDTTFTAEFDTDPCPTHRGTYNTITWSLDCNDVLTLGGTGTISQDGPWAVYKHQIYSIVIEEGLTSIGEHAFDSYINISSITFPESLKSIEKWAFYGCSGLTSINIPNTITNLGEGAFAVCENLTSVTIGDSVASIESFSFNFCSNLTSVTIGRSVRSIGVNAFYCCLGLTSIIIPDNVTNIEDGAFSSCVKLTTVTIGNGVKTINGTAFGECRSLSSVHIRSLAAWCKIKFESLDSNPLYRAHHLYLDNLEVKQLVIPDQITAIEDYAFSGCLGLTSVNIHDGVTSIGKGAFSTCSNITSLSLGCNMKTIKREAFLNCNRLKNIESYAREPALLTIGSIPLNNGMSIYVPCYAVEAYQIAWSSLSSYIKSMTLTQYPYNYILDVKSNITNAGTISLPNSICADTIIQATPNYGYHFTQWNDSVTDNPRTIILTQDTTFIAEFAKNTYSVATETSNMEWGATTGDTIVLYRDTVIITATPNYGYHFVRWNDNNKTNPRRIVVTQDRTYQAIFAKNQYNIQKFAPNGTISGPAKANYLDSVTLTAQPNYGFHFVQWNGSITDNPRTFVLTQDTTFIAEFAKNTYTISTASANPEWGTTSGDTTVLYLDEVEISATPNYGYHFARWNDNNTANPRMVSVTEDTTYTATFAKNVYSITKNAAHGIILGNSSAEYLDVVELIAEPDHGYHFVQWSDSVKENPRTFVLTQDTTFTAEFAQTFEGQCGDSLYWTFNNDSLMFSGSGDMYNYIADSLPWSLLINQTLYIEFASEMTSISDFAFQNMGNLSKLNLSAKIFTIGDFAFENCSLLNYVTIPNSVISLGESAFNGCSSIDTLIIGTGIRTITNQFRGCTGLRYLQLGQGVKSIDYGSFYDARQLIFIVCHPTLPPLAYPDEVGKERSFYNTNAQVLIPCDNFDAYQYDALWGSFNLKCLSSNSGTAVDGQVTVVAGDAEATFTWPTDGSADTYNLEITKDSATFCSLIFDSEGRLSGIAFAPSVNGHQPHMPAATMTTKGMSFQVTGLDYASQYRFSFETKDDNTQTIFAYTGGFHTNGADAPEGFEDISAEGSAPQKVMIDGNVFILRGDKTYTLQGQEIK